MGAKAEALAAQIEGKARDAVTTLQKLGDGDWKKVMDHVKVHVSSLGGPDGDFAEGGPGGRSGRTKHPGGRGRGGQRPTRGSSNAAGEREAERAEPTNAKTRRQEGDG